MNTIISDNFAEIYYELIMLILQSKTNVSPRGLAIKEINNVRIVLTDPTNNLFVNNVRSPNFQYLYPELIWYFSGDKSIDLISRYSKFWKNIQNKDGTVNSAYGYLLFKDINIHGYTEWSWAYESLLNDKDTRQSILRFNKPIHSYKGNLDFVCTLNGIFNIRDNKLNFKINMRSQDMWFGIIYDLPFFTLLQMQMLNHLKNKYSDLILGTFTLDVCSEHIYLKNEKQFLNMLDFKFVSDSTPILNTDLILSSGNSTWEFQQIYESIYTGIPLKKLPTDEFLLTIYKHSIKNEK